MPINVNCAKNIFQQMTYAYYFIDISQNIMSSWVRLILIETRYLGLEPEHKNEIVLIKNY